ncbi:MAG TPA: NIPSNAP family protein [Methylomirabilota bacterium]|nr:NIPSNAP family protein [Methylomirabilota bacterium]
MKTRLPPCCLALLLLFGAIANLSAAAQDTLGYHELRIYHVASNKMDAVVTRFRDVVEPVRARHKIKTLAYWSAPSKTNGGTFIYLMGANSRDELQTKEKAFREDPEFKAGYAASTKAHGKTVDQITTIPLKVGPAAAFNFGSPSSARTFDLRIYDVVPGKMEAFQNRWAQHATRIYARHGLESIAWWVEAQGQSNDSATTDAQRFICLLAGESSDAITKAISSFHADPEWQRIEKETEQNGKLRSAVTAYRLGPLPFSRLR